MPFSPDEIEIKEFVPTLRGYGREEVRAYLRSVSEDIRRLEQQLEVAKSAGSNPVPSGASKAPATTAPTVDSHSSSPKSGVDDHGLAHELKTALSELTQAVSSLGDRKSRDPARNEPGRNEPARNEPARNEPGRNEPARNEPGRNDPGRNDPGRNTSWDRHPRGRPDVFEIGSLPLAPTFDRKTRLEPRFETAKPAKQITNSRSATPSGTHWAGLDRRGQTRPWQTHRSTSSATNRSDFHAVYDPADVDPKFPVDREQANRSLIGAYLDQALGRQSKELNIVEIEADRVGPEGSDRENVVAFMRAVS